MITLIPLTDNYTILQVSEFESIPPLIFKSEFYSVTKTEDEISIVTNCADNFNGLKSDGGWKGFKVDGILDFSLVGIINEITRPLNDHKISVFVISTYNTDYLFVKNESFLHAIEIFKMSDSVKIQNWKHPL